MRRFLSRVLPLLLSFGLIFNCTGCSTVLVLAGKARENSEASSSVISESSASSGIISTPVPTEDGDLRAFYTDVANAESVTVMVYMIGSDLESEDGSATDDLLEMADAALSENIHLVLQTGGTETWWNDVCTDDESERFVIENGDMTLLQSLGSMNMTDADTLSDFIRFSAESYPADRYELILWDHGGGTMTGFGYDELYEDTSLTLSSLSTSDYPHLVELCDDLEDFCAQRHVMLALPSLRADNFSMALMERLQKGRKTGLTFAPEAGTQRLRDAINKNLTEEDLLESCRRAFAGGYSAVKLYFMLGLPTETDEDVLGIADIAAHVMHAWRESAVNKSRGVRITVSTSWFVPKPHTAFQWEPQIPIEEYERRVKLLREAMTTKSVTYNWHPSPTSFMEAVISCGDRRLGKVIESAWRKGETLSAWEDYFDLDRWMAAFEECGLDPHFYANRRRSEDEILPWSMISTGVSPAYFKREHALAFEGVTTPDCRTHCNACGANCLVGGTCNV